MLSLKGYYFIEFYIWDGSIQKFRKKKKINLFYFAFVDKNFKEIAWNFYLKFMPKPRPHSTAYNIEKNPFPVGKTEWRILLWINTLIKDLIMHQFPTVLFTSELGGSAWCIKDIYPDSIFFSMLVKQIFQDSLIYFPISPHRCREIKTISLYQAVYLAIYRILFIV